MFKSTILTDVSATGSEALKASILFLMPNPFSLCINRLTLSPRSGYSWSGPYKPMTVIIPLPDPPGIASILADITIDSEEQSDDLENGGSVKDSE